jgi:hypothetical protein
MANLMVNCSAAGRTRGVNMRRSPLRHRSCHQCSALRMCLRSYAGHHCHHCHHYLKEFVCSGGGIVFGPLPRHLVTVVTGSRARPPSDPGARREQLGAAKGAVAAATAALTKATAQVSRLDTLAAGLTTLGAAQSPEVGDRVVGAGQQLVDATAAAATATATLATATARAAVAAAMLVAATALLRATPFTDGDPRPWRA